MSDILREPVLYVGEINEDVNLSLPPSSGEDYLKRVIIEAQQCDEIAYTKIEKNRLRKPVVNVKPLPECEKAPESLSPCIEWQDCQIADFSNSRLQITRLRDEIFNSKRKKTCPIKLPNPEDQNNWIKICTSLEEENYIQPTLSVILTLRQSTIEVVLEYLIEYLQNQNTIDPNIGRWIYALLAALELPLDPDVCSLLRSLARICSTIRSQLSPGKSTYAEPLNLFICLVARYFRQLDLADEG